MRLTDITNLLIEEIATENHISKSEAKKLLINALAYNTVVAEIKEQINFLIENDVELY